ncbi:cell adhesion molecule 2-like [Larimichthys crocea]|uniref:cell adhesion molecule 2-like n=1 Tax=Larimichthys crocea TaxID=215358 RepID=UPI000900C374|nr:cell adhesion molecule 2-like [Larimichthys crocea]
MNTSDTLSSYTSAAVTDAAGMRLSTLKPTQAATTMSQVVTTAAATTPPTGPDSAVIAVVIVLILLTVAALSFLLYRYLCHNKGDYRTTGELAPGEDPDEEHGNQATNEKKEYFI